MEVAAAVSSDNIQSVSQWMDDNRLAPVSDEQALGWEQKDEHRCAVFSAPWVLFQLVKKL